MILAGATKGLPRQVDQKIANAGNGRRQSSLHVGCPLPLGGGPSYLGGKLPDTYALLVQVAGPCILLVHAARTGRHAAGGF